MRLIRVGLALILIPLSLGISSFSLNIDQGEKKGLSVKPNLSGRWEMDEIKSELGPSLRAGGYKEILVIDHQEPKLTIHYTVKYEGQQLNEVFHLTTDGAENINQSVIGEERSRTRWEGGKLISEWKVLRDTGIREAGKITRALSPDGKILNVEYQKESRGGLKLVFVKKPS